MKRLISTLLATVMILSTCALCALTVNADEVIQTAYLGPSGDNGFDQTITKSSV